MTYTPEQIEAMAACLQEIVSFYGPLNIREGNHWETRMAEHGIVTDDGRLAPWLAPPDDSVALDHPNAASSLSMWRDRGSHHYQQWILVAGNEHLVSTRPHPTEEAARKEWNAICRRAK